MSTHSTDELVAAGLVGDHRSPFGLPRGLQGRLAGWYMSHSDAQHREVCHWIDSAAPHSIIEIGFGPGTLLQMVQACRPRTKLAGVDPSELMVERARRRVPTAELHIGAAAMTPFAAGGADLVVSVDNVPMWPDIDAGLVEVHRILAGGGHVLIAWHGGHDPRGHQRRLVLDEIRQTEITVAIGRHFANSETSMLQHSTIWTATKV